MLYLLIVILPIIMQVICIIHVIKTHKSFIWVYVIVFLPLAGCIAYFIVEIIPHMASSDKTKEIKNKIINTIDPTKEIRELEDKLTVSDTFNNKKKLADAYKKAGRFDDAIIFYNKCLQGIFKDDVDVIGNIGVCYYYNKRFEDARKYFLAVLEKNKKYSSMDHWLIYIKTLENLKDLENTENEYKKLLESHQRFEVIINYGEFLKNAGRLEEAKEKFEYVINSSRTLPKYNLILERIWIERAKKNLSSL